MAATVFTSSAFTTITEALASSSTTDTLVTLDTGGVAALMAKRDVFAGSPLYIVVDNEAMSVLGIKSATEIYVSRAALGTTIATHSDNSLVFAIDNLSLFNLAKTIAANNT